MASTLMLNGKNVKKWNNQITNLQEQKLPAVPAAFFTTKLKNLVLKR